MSVTTTVAERPKTRTRSISLINDNIFIFAAGLIAYVLAAYYFTAVLRIYHNDSVARAALGMFVTYSRDPHLASVGFVWTPLDSLLHLPLFPLLRWWGQPGLGGPLISAFFAAATLPLVNETGKLFGAGRWLRLALVVLYGLHPTILLYASVGMSETSFFFFQAIGMYFILRWASQKIGNSGILLAGLATALAFWVRYEAMPLLIGLAAVVLVMIFSWNRHDPPLFRGSLEAVWIALLVPTIYSLAVWIFFNWLIQGDPLFFWQGQYTNTAYTEQFRSAVNPLYHSPLNALFYGLERVSYQFVLFVPLLFFGIGTSIWKRSLGPFVPLFIPLTLIFFHVYLSYSGSSYGWYRFYTYALPAAVLVFFWFLQYFHRYKSMYRLLVGLMLAGLALSYLTTIVGMSNSEIGKEEVTFLEAVRTGGAAPQQEYRSYAVAQQVAAYINQNHLEGLILVDTYLGFSIVLFSEQPQHFVITQDRDFKDILRDPPGKGVKWILLPRVDDSQRGTEAIWNTFPDMWEKGVSWASIEKDFGLWRLYKVTGPIEKPILK